MITIKRKDEKVQFEIEHGIFYADQHFVLELNQAYPYQAELLRKAFQDNLNRHLINIKEKYYNEGWKNAKAKTKKKRHDDFYGGWEK